MRAAVLFQSPGKLQIEDVVVDDPQPYEVRVKVAAAGLCHSDLHRLDRAYPLASPLVLGHEGAGVVEAVGSSVTYVQPGDHVIGFSTPACGTCEFCRADRPTLCDGVTTRRSADQPPRLRLPDGRPLTQMTGLATFAEEMLVHENALVKIDMTIPLEAATLVGCAVPTGVGGVLRAAQVRAGATVAVIGCGGIGLNCLQGARLAGASRIVAIDINDGKLDFARRFGATDTINNADGSALDQLAALLPGSGGVDYSFECLGRPETYELAFRVLRKGGLATGIGISPGSFPIVASDLLWGRTFQGCIMGSVRYREDLPHYLDLYRRGELMLDELVSRRIRLDEINAGYAAISDGSVARSVVVFGGV
jgi:S-(hydroxymethyl)glutathione dehydrogenase/alcohol dehydrogenase